MTKHLLLRDLLPLFLTLTFVSGQYPQQPPPGYYQPGPEPPHYLQPHDGGAHSECRDERGQPQKCSPEYKNIAFGELFTTTSTCGEHGPSEYCVQSGALGLRRACDVCDARDPRRNHPPRSLTDLTTNDNETWWQSETMYEGIQYPFGSVNLTLNLGKAFDIIHITMKFHSARPESLAIYKKTSPTGPWIPFQYFSQSCRDVYKLPDLDSITGNGTEARALCKSEYTDHSPLTGGSVVFVTLEGRPSKENFENSRDLNDWVTATDIRIALDKMNTFGDDVFGDEKVLRSYFYAISDITIGGTCKCNGHARQCVESRGLNGERARVCQCEHHTAGVDCEECEPFYRDVPWGRASSANVHECKSCDCNGFSDRCHFNKTLYEQTGSGGYCTECRGNRDGPKCERCKPNYYERSDGYCIPCNCHEDGSTFLQCNELGQCSCAPGVTGEKCQVCLSNHYGLTKGGCKKCACNEAGSSDNAQCDSVTGKCSCKTNVIGDACDSCKLGFFNLDVRNQFGCTPCFCYGHSSVCTSAGSYGQVTELSAFNSSTDRWKAFTSSGQPVPLRFSAVTQNLEVSSPSHEAVYFHAPDRFLGDHRGAYNQLLNFTLRIGEHGPKPGSEDIILEGGGYVASRPIFAHNSPLPSPRGYDYSVRLHEDREFGWNPRLTAKEFMSMLVNLTAVKIRGTYTPRGTGFLDDVRLSTARIGSTGSIASWVESCTCPEEYSEPFCDSCSAGYTRYIPNGGLFARCVKCSCHGHAVTTRSNVTSCDRNTGQCICQHNTTGDNCERCARGFYGNAQEGTENDCHPCPCPKGKDGIQGPCIQLDDEELVCLECPVGYGGPLCEVCRDGYFGDPQKGIPCQPCGCNGNIDPNAVGNCHRVTGECLKCIHNTGGENCSACLPGFYGDALAPTKGDCKPCACSSLGTIPTPSGQLLCSQTTGKCPCKPNVTTRQCDVCEDGYFDLQSGQGCKDCGCHPVGSVNASCDAHYGQCTCQTGVVGLQCKECGPNRYGFSKEGCKACDCDYVGALGLQCGPDGQCVCRENVEGLRCDRCKENKHSRELGCIDCPACYNLVQDATNAHRAKLLAMEELLEQIRSAPTVATDREFEMKLQTVQQRVNKLWTDARKATGADDKSFLEKVGELKEKLAGLDVLNEGIKSNLATCSIHSGTATRNLTIIESTIERALDSLRTAHRFLDADGQDALARAQAQTSTHTQQSSTLTDLTRQTRLLADEHEKKAQELEKLGLESLNRSTVAHEMARGVIGSQDAADREAKTLLAAVAQLDEEVRVTGGKAKEGLEKAKEAYSDALSLYKDANSLTLPTIDLTSIKESAQSTKTDAARLTDSVSSVAQHHAPLLAEAEDETGQTKARLNDAIKYQQIAEDLMGDLDKTKAEAEEARVQSENTFKEAKEIYETLKGFNQNVEESKEKAYAAEGRIPNIQRLIAQAERETITNQQDLEGAKSLASEALANARDAKTIAEKASKDSTNIRAECNTTKLAATSLHDETNSLTGKLAETTNRLAITESKIGDEDSKVKSALDRASEAQNKAKASWEKVQSALATVRDIQLALNNLPDVNESGLDALSASIALIEKEFMEAGLDAKLAELRNARNQQALWVKNYEEELELLKKEVENVQEIRDSLPPDTRCWKKLRLEP